MINDRRKNRYFVLKDILVEMLDTLQDLDDKIAEFTDDEKTLEYEIELRRFVKEIIRKIGQCDR